MKAKKLMCMAMAGVVTSGVNLTPYSAAASAPHCDGYVATFTGTRGANYLIGTPKDDVIVGRGGNDSSDGKGGNDIICGGRGDDTVRGGRGKDRIFGQVGDDRFDAGNDKGDDSLNGGHGQDLLLLSFEQGSDLEPKGLGPAHVDLAAGYARIVGGGRDSIALGTMEDVYGTSWGNVIRGDDRANVLHVGVYDGAARLIGRGGDDTLVGGQDGGVYFDGGDGDDLINLISGTNEVHGGAGTDELSFCGPYAGTGYDAEVDLTQGRASTSMHGNEDAGVTLDSIENATSCGGDDTLVGDAGPNILVAGSGDDALEGREGDDRLGGGAGDDSGDGGDGIDTCTGIESPVNCE